MPVAAASKDDQDMGDLEILPEDMEIAAQGALPSLVYHARIYL